MAGDDAKLNELRTAWQNEMPAAIRVTRERLLRQERTINRRLIAATGAMVALCILEMAVFAKFAADARDPLRRLGAVLTSVGFAYLMYQLWKNLRIVRDLRQRLAGAPSLVFSRAFHEHMREWSRGRWFWPRLIALAPGPILYFIAGIRHGESPVLLTVYVALLVLAIFLNVILGVRIANKKLAELDRVAGPQ